MAKAPWVSFGFSALDGSAASSNDVGNQLNQSVSPVKKTYDSYTKATSEEVLALFGWSKEEEGEE